MSQASAGTPYPPPWVTMTDDDGRRKEAARQAAVLAALHAHLPRGAMLNDTQTCMPALRAAGVRTDAAGLRAYQGNARALACRVLASTYPTITAMVGHEALNALALRLWQRSPPASGDLAEWGEGLANLIATQPTLQDWPWLPDSARLDWACHTCERAADAELDAASLQQMGEDAPDNLGIALQPSVRLLNTNWPVAALQAAHRLPQDLQVTAATQALQERKAGAFVIWRAGWQVRTQALPDDWGAWMRLLGAQDMSGAAPGASAPWRSLAQLLADAPAAFDFTAWLTSALREGWLWRVRKLHPNLTTP